MEKSETLFRNTQELWEKHYKIIIYYPFSKNKWIVAKKCLKKQKKIRNPKNNKGNDQVENKKTTTKKRQCKPNNVGNEHDTSGLLQRNVYRNKKIRKPKQQVENKKTTTNNKTT
jgi:hypothetical protein